MSRHHRPRLGQGGGSIGRALPAPLLLATDPVALDAHALTVINSLRQPNDPVPTVTGGQSCGCHGLDSGAVSLN